MGAENFLNGCLTIVMFCVIVLNYNAGLQMYFRDGIMFTGGGLPGHGVDPASLPGVGDLDPHMPWEKAT